MVHLHHPSSHPWAPEGQRVGKLSQARGPFFKREQFEAACSCLFPHLIKIPALLSGIRTHYKRTLRGRSSIPFFPEEQTSQPTCKMKDTHCLFNIWGEIAPTELHLSLVILSKQDHPLESGNQRLGSCTFLRITLLVSPGARVSWAIFIWGLLRWG